MDNSYKAIITSEHKDKPKFNKTVSAFLQKLQENLSTIAKVDSSV